MKYLKAFLCLTLFAWAGCFCRPSVMSQQCYDNITIGTPIEEVEAEAGEPRDVCCKGTGLEEYEYIERIPMPGYYAVENIYHLEVLHGIVIAKSMTTLRTPAYNGLYQTGPNFTPSIPSSIPPR